MKLSVCVDLDGVLAYYEGWKGIEHIGEPIPGAAEFTKNLSKDFRVVIFTTRCKEYLGITPGPSEKTYDPDRRPATELAQIVTNWLNKHGFTFDEVYVGQGKPFAVVYIDDRAVQCTPQRFAGCEFSEFNLALEWAQSAASLVKPSDTSSLLKESQ